MERLGQGLSRRSNDAGAAVEQQGGSGGLVLTSPGSIARVSVTMARLKEQLDAIVKTTSAATDDGQAAACSDGGNAGTL